MDIILVSDFKDRHSTSLGTLDSRIGGIFQPYNKKILD